MEGPVFDQVVGVFLLVVGGEFAPSDGGLSGFNLEVGVVVLAEPLVGCQDALGQGPDGFRSIVGGDEAVLVGGGPGVSLVLVDCFSGWHFNPFFAGIEGVFFYLVFHFGRVLVLLELLSLGECSLDCGHCYGASLGGVHVDLVLEEVVVFAAIVAAVVGWGKGCSRVCCSLPQAVGLD